MQRRVLVRVDAQDLVDVKRRRPAPSERVHVDGELKQAICALDGPRCHHASDAQLHLHEVVVDELQPMQHVRAVQPLLQLEDGTSILVRNAGRMVPQPDGSYHGRTHAELEVPSGPHEALAEMVLFGTAFSPADAPEHVFIELWHAAI